MNEDIFGALLVLAAVYCLGGLHGLLVAWTQESRMQTWAGRVHRIHRKLAEFEERGMDR